MIKQVVLIVQQHHSTPVILHFPNPLGIFSFISLLKNPCPLNLYVRFPKQNAHSHLVDYLFINLTDGQSFLEFPLQ